MSIKKQKLLIAEDHPITLAGIKLLSKEVLPNTDILDCNTLNDVYKLVKEKKPNILILDLFLGKENTMMAIPELLFRNPSLNILVMSTGSELIYGNRVIKEGAKGYINKLASNEEFYLALTQVAGGNFYISQKLFLNNLDKFNSASGSNANPFDRLTNKETEMAIYIMEGLTTTEISERTHLQKNTVSTYRKRIYEKLNVEDIKSLIDLANVYQFKHGT